MNNDDLLELLATIPPRVKLARDRGLPSAEGCAADLADEIARALRCDESNNFVRRSALIEGVIHYNAELDDATGNDDDFREVDN